MTQPTPVNLRGFSKPKAALVRQMEDDGWTGRLSANGHAIMRAPDGETTCSVSPKMGSPRDLANSSAVYKRWKRERARTWADLAASDGTFADTQDD